MILAIRAAFESFDVVYSRTDGVVCFGACHMFRF